MASLGASLRGIGRSGRRKVQGLLFLGVVVGLLLLTVGIYNKAFSSSVNVTLDVQRVGHQLVIPADVKLRGILVGQVRSISTNGQYAQLHLAIDPGKAALIPSNVVAEIVPKTLFGEKYVNLVIPAQPSPLDISQVADPTIGEDRSSTAIEAETVFNHLLPLLQALKPVELNQTLTAIATALHGQGAALGANLAAADRYFTRFNPHLGTLEHDISGLADLASNYSQAAPDLLAMLNNFSVNARTLVQKQSAFANFLIGTRGFADTATQVISQNADNLISLANVSEPTLSVLARYSPEFTCLLVGLDKIHPYLSATFGQHLKGSSSSLHIYLVAQNTNAPAYKYPLDAPSRDLPALARAGDLGPNCRGLPNAAPPPGYSLPPGFGPSAAQPAPGPGASSSAFSIGPAGSPGDVAAVDTVVAPLLGEPSSQVSPMSDLLIGPVLRGAAVSYQ